MFVYQQITFGLVVDIVLFICVCVCVRARACVCVHVCVWVFGKKGKTKRRYNLVSIARTHSKGHLHGPSD